MAKEARVFISHSAADRTSGDPVQVLAHDVRVAIREKLDAHYHVLIDEVELKAGDVWRERINVWLNGCDAAVLVLSPAALKSFYVIYEANVLGHRWAIDRQNFKIIPVLVGVTMDEVKNTALGPAQVGEWQNAPSGTPEEIADRVFEALEGLVPSKSRPIDRLASVLKQHIPAEQTVLDAAGKVLKIDPPWTTDEKAFQLALRLLGSGMVTECAKAIRYFPDDTHFKKQKETSLEVIKALITSAWVDIKAGEIHDNVSTPDPRPMLLNAESRVIAETYLTALRYQRTDYLRYNVVEAAVVLDEQLDNATHEQLVIDKVRIELETRLRKKGSALTAALAAYHSLGEATIVMLHEHSLTPALLPKLQTEFKYVTFFILGGPMAGSIVNQDGRVFVVRPPLDTGEEDAFLTQRNDFCGWLDLI